MIKQGIIQIVEPIGNRKYAIYGTPEERYRTRMRMKKAAKNVKYCASVTEHGKRIGAEYLKMLQENVDRE